MRRRDIGWKQHIKICCILNCEVVSFSPDTMGLSYIIIFDTLLYPTHIPSSILKQNRMSVFIF